MEKEMTRKAEIEAIEAKPEFMSEHLRLKAKKDIEKLQNEIKCIEKALAIHDGLAREIRRIKDHDYHDDVHINGIILQ